MPGSNVIFMDSGLGGLSHCPDFLALCPSARLIYFADSARFPYGPKGRAQLEGLIVANTAKLIARFDPSVVVIACNTASIASLKAVRAAFPSVHFVGTVPAVKLAGEYSRSRRIGVIATERTVNEPYIFELAAHHAPDATIVPIADGELVDFVERRYARSTLEDRLDAARPSLERCLAAGCDAVVLACTHFMFLAREFTLLAGDRARIFDSRDGVARRTASLYASCSLALDEGGGGSPHANPGSSTADWLYLESVRGEGGALACDQAREALIRSFGFSRLEALPAGGLLAESLPEGIASGSRRGVAAGGAR